MSDLGSSAAGLIAVANLPTPRYGTPRPSTESSTARPVRGPSDSSSRSFSPTSDPTSGAASDPYSKQGGTDRIWSSVDSGHRLGGAKGYESTFDAERQLDEQSDRIAELVDRFEQAINRIKQFLRSADVGDPPSPTELQERIDPKHSFAAEPEPEVGTAPFRPTPVPPSDELSLSLDNPPTLNVVL